MKKICCLVLAILPLSAFAYPIDVEKQLNGLKIDYTTYAAGEAAPQRPHWRELRAHDPAVMLEDLTLNRDALVQFDADWLLRVGKSEA